VVVELELPFPWSASILKNAGAFRLRTVDGCVVRPEYPYSNEKCTNHFEFSEDLCRLLEASIEKADRKLWAELRKKGEERDELVERAETSAHEKDDFVAVVMAALPDLAATRGVYSAPALKERYLTMHRVASRVGFLPEGGGSLPSMLIGFIKAILIITPANPIPCHELLNEPFDPAELDNFEILQRAQFYMDKGDWYMVLSYLNLLKGASRAVSSNFINELRLYLETKAIADSLMCHAAARFLAF
ncbi:unnamed protein product, partial [Nesidiocoris tenuis]